MPGRSPGSLYESGQARQDRGSRIGVPLPRSRTNCFNCDQRASEWGCLERPGLKALNDGKISNTYKKGQVIFYQGNPCLGIYCVSRGCIALRKDDEQGNSLILRLLEPGQTLGYRSFFTGQVYSATAVAQTESEICFIDRASMRNLLKDNPRLALAFLERAGADLRESDDARLEAATLPLRIRLCRLMLVLRIQHGEVDQQGRLLITFPLSRRDMAAMLGSRPETVTRVIRQLEDAKVAQFKGRTALVDDLDLLLDEIELVV
jgi:CRP-like cAMP-binding protein